MMQRSYFQELLREIWPKIRAITNGIVVVIEKIIGGFINILKQQIGR